MRSTARGSTRPRSGCAAHRQRPPGEILSAYGVYEDRPSIAWSADGKRIVVLERTYSVLRVISTRTGKVLRRWRFGILARATISPQAVSADGGRVTFTLADGIGQPLVQVADVASGEVRQIAAEQADPAFDVTGTRIATTRGKTLSVMGLDGVVQAAFTLAVPYIGKPAWSPDGRAIAAIYSAGRSADGIAVLRTESGALSRRLAVSRRFLQSPRWSPDGTKLAVNSFPMYDE